jgi:hypothetical protein
MIQLNGRRSCVLKLRSRIRQLPKGLMSGFAPRFTFNSREQGINSGVQMSALFPDALGISPNMRDDARSFAPPEKRLRSGRPRLGDVP